MTDADTSLPIYSYSIAHTKLPIYNVEQLDSLFVLIKNEIAIEYGKIDKEVRVVQSYKQPRNEYEYFIDKHNNYRRETYIRVEYYFGDLYYITINGKINQKNIAEERQFINNALTHIY